MITVVTGFVPIPEHPRPEIEYRKLGERLLHAAVPYGVAQCMAIEMKLTDCWLYQYLHWRGTEFKHSISDNPKKNSPAYHIVQAQKSELLLEAARSNAIPDVFVWIDFGIFHLRGMTEQILIDFLQRAQYEKAIAIPGCWSLPYKYDDNHPCWRFCGGVMIVPRKYVIELDVAMKAEYLRHIKETNNLSWEVNTLARLEKRRSNLPIWWYPAETHDASMFTNYEGSGHVVLGGVSETMGH